MQRSEEEILLGRRRLNTLLICIAAGLAIYLIISLIIGITA